MKFEYTREDLTGAKRTPDAPPRRGVRTMPPPPPRPSSGWLKGFFGCLVLVLLAGGGVWWWWVGQPSAQDPLQAVVSPGGTDSPRGAAVPQAKVAEQDLENYLDVKTEDVVPLFESIRNSSVVKQNTVYTSLTKDIAFTVFETNDTINAYATRVPKPAIVCYAGEVRFAHVLGLAVSAELGGNKGVLKRFMNGMTPAHFRSFSMENAKALVNECELAYVLGDENLLSEARSIAAGEIMATLAHETGHHVLGHVWNDRDARARQSKEVRRNQEREADSFASSVISLSHFGKHVFVGQLFSWWVMSKVDAASDATLDHPLSQERFDNLVRANKAKAAALGLSVD